MNNPNWSVSGLLTGDERPKALRYRKPFTNWGIDEIHEVSILVHGEPAKHVSGTGKRCAIYPYRLAAFAVSITLPPPTLQNRILRRTLWV
jgi:hypothetical protein